MNIVPLISGCFTRNENLKTKNANNTSMDYNKKLYKQTSQDGVISSDPQFSKKGNKKTDTQAFVKNFDEFRKFSKQKDEKYASKLMLSTDESINGDEPENEGPDAKTQVYTPNEWLKILKNNDLDNSCHTEIVQSLRHGIKDDLRPQIWAFLAKAEQYKKQYADGFYHKLTQTANRWDSQIQRDIDRTFSDHPFFNDDKKRGQQLLFNVLRAYANFDNEIGYTQGMNFIVGALLIILDPDNFKNSSLPYLKDYEKRFDEDAFWIFMNIAFVKNYRVIYKENFPKLRGMLDSLDQRIKTKVPEIDRHIKKHGMETFICFHQMFFSMMLIYNPFEIVKRIIDLFLIEEERVLFKVLMRAIILCKREILQQDDPAKLRDFLNQQMMYACYEKCKGKLYMLFPTPESTD